MSDRVQVNSPKFPHPWGRWKLSARSFTSQITLTGPSRLWRLRKPCFATHATHPAWPQLLETHSMETFEATAVHRQTRIRITSTQPTQFIDLTEEIHGFVDEAGVRVGMLNIQSLHTTAAIVVNESEPLLLA